MRHFLIALSLLLMSACGGGGSSDGTTLGAAPSTRGEVVSTSAVKTLPVTAITNFATSSGLTGSNLQYAVDYYALTYTTIDPAGKLVNASGLLLIPKKPANSPSPILSLQHGTLVYEPWAPSYADGTLNGTASESQVGFIVAANGYIVLLPDYLGYGASKQLFHPYIHAQTLASASIDMLRASKQFLTSHNIALNNQLFLAGYSEGGYATLAMQKELETNLAGEFAITASEPGSGPYDLTSTTRSVFTATDLTGITDPMYLTFLVDAYDRYYNSPSQLSSYLTTTAFNCSNTYFIGAYGVIPAASPPYYSTYDDCMNTFITADILSPTFLTAFNGMGETTLKAAITANDIYNWTPHVSTRLYYSLGDDVVPAANSLTAYNTMVNNGATTVATATCNVPVPTHANCAAPYLNDVFTHFAAMAQNL